MAVGEMEDRGGPSTVRASNARWQARGGRALWALLRLSCCSICLEVNWSWRLSERGRLRERGQLRLSRVEGPVARTAALKSCAPGCWCWSSRELLACAQIWWVFAPGTCVQGLREKELLVARRGWAAGAMGGRVACGDLAACKVAAADKEKRRKKKEKKKEKEEERKERRRKREKEGK